MKIQRSIPILLIALAFSSCTAYHDISVEQQAKAKIPENVRVIGVINSIDDLNSNKVNSSKLKEKQQERNQATIAMATNGAFNSILGHGGRGQVLDADSVMHIHGGLDWTLLDSIAKSDSIDFFIELSEFRITNTIGTAVIAKLAGQTGSQRLNGTLIVNMRSVGAGEIQSEYTVESSVTVAVSGDLTDIEFDTQRKRAGYERLGYDIGFAASELMYSHPMIVTRMYYKSGSPSIKASRRMMSQRNWDGAEVELLKNVDDGKHKPRGKALLNLAVIKEAQGDLDKAIEYAERSANECFNTHAKTYLAKLQERKGIVVE